MSDEIKLKVDKHGEDIATLQSDYRHLSLGVSELSVRVNTLSTSLVHLDNTIREASSSFKTIIGVLKFIGAVVTVGSTLLGIYLTLH